MVHFLQVIWFENSLKRSKFPKPIDDAIDETENYKRNPEYFSLII